MNKTVLLLVLLLGMYFINACQKLDAIQAPDEFQLGGYYGTYVDTTLYPTKALFKVDDRVNTASGLKLCVGSYKGFNAGFLLRFFGLPSIDQAMDSVYIELTSYGIMGDNQRGPIEIGMYQVESQWAEDANTQNEWHNYQPQNLLATFTIDPTDTFKLKASIDTTVVNSWRATDSTNFGLFFKQIGGNGDFIRQFESLENNNANDWPKLYFLVKKDSVFSRDSIRIGYDATIFDYVAKENNLFDWTKEQGDLIIGSGLGVHTFLRFPALDSLSSKAQIKNADLILTVRNDDFFTNDPVGNSYNNGTVSSSFYIRSVTNADSNLTSFTIDSSFVSNLNFNYTLTQLGDTLSLYSDNEKMKFGVNFIQNLINKKISSEWLYLQYKDEVSAFSLKRLYGLGSGQIMLKVRYFLIDNSVL